MISSSFFSAIKVVSVRLSFYLFPPGYNLQRFPPVSLVALPYLCYSEPLGCLPGTCKELWGDPVSLLEWVWANHIYYGWFWDCVTILPDYQKWSTVVASDAEFMQSRKWSTHWTMIYVTKNDHCILCGDLLLMLDFLKEGSAVYERKQCIKVYLTPLCATEQHGIFYFQLEIWKGGREKGCWSWLGYKVFISLFFVC